MLFIENATILTPSKIIPESTVWAVDGRIQATLNPVRPPPPQARVINAKGMYLVPGFIDLQLNGGFGHDFTQNPESIWSVSNQLSQYGVTTFLPTIITSPLATIEHAQTVLAGGPPPGFYGAKPLGLHLEGPFLNPQKKGAHNPCHMQHPQLLDWSPATQIRLVTLALELPKATAIIQALTEQGVIVSAGHSLATYSEACNGFTAGIRYATHLFNAMPSLHHREPGLIGAVLADERITVGLIADGVHVHPALIKIVWQILADGRLNLVTDAMAALGMPSGTYQLGDFEVIVRDTSAQRPDGTLAGSVLSLDQALRNLITYTGCSLTEALPSITTTPAQLLGLSHCKGHVAPGYDADLALLNADLTVAYTIVQGEVVYENFETNEEQTLEITHAGDPATSFF